MKNVVVFALSRSHWAIELRWVREIFTLGHVTPVPSAAAAIAGVVNRHGAIVPVIDLEHLGAGERTVANSGEGAILVEIDDVRAALRLTSVDEVSTLHEREDRSGHVTDSRGREVPVLDPHELVARLRALGVGEAGHG